MLPVEQDLRGEADEDRFCNQFVLGPRFIDALPGWQRVVLDHGLRLSAHPQLAIERISDGGKSVTIIGHIFDYRFPDRDNAAIGQGLLGGFSDIDALLSSTGDCGGRWIIIASDGNRQVLFTDALGLRQVFYTSAAGAQALWVASQPGLLAWLLDLHIDAAAERFLDSLEVRSHSEYRWPAAATPFRETVHLLPNHCLDLSEHRCRRYWPDRPLDVLTPDDALERAVRILKGLMRAIRQRFDFVIGITAGSDSRIVLAASREIKAGIQGITVRQGTMPDNHQDIAIAARVLSRAGVPHRVIKALPYMSAEFGRKFKQNVFLAHDHYGPDVEAICDLLGRSTVAVTGGGAEVVKAPFRNRIDASKREFTSSDLARLQWMGRNEFALSAYDRWLQGARERHNVHLLDLFSWEQSHGNWLAATQLEFDMAWRDIFTPFNCRKLLVTILSMDERYRRSPDHQALRALIKKMWPQLLDEPINPDRNGQSTGCLARVGKRARNLIRGRSLGVNHHQP